MSRKNDVQLTVITDQGAKTTGPMPDRDARIVEALAEITGNIASRDNRPGR